MISVRTTVALMLGTIAALLLGLGYVATWQVRTAGMQAAAETRRHDSYRIAEAMRQSSDQLTMMVRLYVSTGQPLYRDYFQEILAIRSGQAPRPLDYDGSFWDRVLAHGEAGVRYGPPKSLERLMREAGFSEAEFEALNTSRQASDELARIEIEVMEQVARRIAAGVDARYFADIQPQYLRLVDAAYLGHKERIMAAVEQVQRMVDDRTRADVEALRARSDRLIRSQIAFLSLMLVLSVVAFLISERALTRPLRQLMDRTRRIASGDYGQRVGSHGLHELNQLGATFNHMAAAIQSDIARRQAAEASAQAAQRVAEAANQAKSDFLANMSHEIRTPLNAVIGMTEMLQETRLDSEQRECLDTIANSGSHLLGVINDILDFSKIEAGMLELDSQVFDLRRCLEDAMELVAPKATQKRLDLALDFVAGTPEGLRGDPQRLRQVLVNFLSNAVKFTAKGEVVVTVRALQLAEDRHRFDFEVRDTGIGIPPERMDRLFKSFSQVDTSTTRNYGGTGLGLAICKRLVEMMGGDVSAESAVGEGSRFRFSIQAETHPDWVASPVGDSADFEGRRVLVVDDNDTNRRLLRAAAEFWGMQVRDTAHPAEALEWVARGDPFDVAVFDYLMPGMDGRALGQAVRRYRDGQRLPLIMASSAPMTRRSAPEFSAVLAKPLRRSTLFDAFQDVLSDERLRNRAEPLPPSLATEPGTTVAPSPLRILLAEDDETNQKITLRMLRSLGYSADLAQDGAEAVKAVEDGQYDLVLMDVHMPVMDGLEATRRIRRLPYGKQPRIFAMTASVLDSERLACLEAGMERHIAKPIQKQMLAIALSEVEPRSAGQSEVAPSPTVSVDAPAPAPAPAPARARLAPAATVTGAAATMLTTAPPSQPPVRPPAEPTPPTAKAVTPPAVSAVKPTRVALPLPALAGLALLLLCTLAAAWQTQGLVREQQKARFDFEVRRIDAAVQQRMATYVQVLRGGQGLFEASSEVTREDWRRYVASLQLPADYPGIRTLSYVPRVLPEEAEAFIARVRAEPLPTGVSDPNLLRGYRFRDPPPPVQPVNSPVHAPVLYTEPLATEKGRSLGIDMMRDAGRRAVMEAAIASGQPRLSSRLKILNPTGTQVGFIIYLPLHREQRLLGWLTAVFHAQTFMDGLLGADYRGLEFEIFDGLDPVSRSRLYSTAGLDETGEPRPLKLDGPGQLLKTSELTLAGRPWSIRYVATPGFESPADQLAPWIVIAVGLLLSLLFYVVARGGQHWQSLAAQLSAQAVVLEQARAVAESATSAKSDFLANMSHEIRTPLNAIIGMTELLAESRLDEEQRSSLHTISHSSEHLLGVINDILDFSKIEAGMLELDPRVFDLRRCVEDAMELVAPAAAKKGLDLALEYRPGTPEGLRGDSGRVRQVLVNFLSNAVKFTASGEVVVTVSAQALEAVEDSSGQWLGRHEFRIEVRDTGIGIPPDRMDRLFKSFSQVDTSTTRHYGGTGLGLAISKRLAELMGGSAWVRSEPGRGSVFGFSLIGETHEAWSLSPQPSASADFEGRRLLVVDDNETNRRLLRDTAEFWHMQVRDTASPEEALNWIARGDPFDLAVLDYLMPGMDGRSLAQAIRVHRSAAELPLVMASSAVLTRRSAPEFVTVLSKPLRRSALFEAFELALASEAVWQAPVIEKAAEPSFSSLRILLVEDNETNQKVTLRMLKSLGYQADVAVNGAEALAAVQARRYDLVLMDVHMPVMDGLEATRRIRQLPPLEQPRIFAMTASVLDSERQECAEAGMERHIAKPVQRALLAEALASVEPRQPPPRAPAPAAAPGLDRPESSPGPAVPEPAEPLEVRAATLEQFLDEQVAELSREGVLELIESLVQGAEKAMGQLQGALASGDAAVLKRVTHTLKSNTAMVGALALSDLCAELEAKSRSGELAGLEAPAQQLAEGYRALVAGLARLRPRYLG